MGNPRDPGMPEHYRGTLARASLAGGAPRPIADDVEFADWAPDGTLAAVRAVRARRRVQFPVGSVIVRAGTLRRGDTVRVAD